MYLICWNNLAPDTAGARFVVSLKGESLSPKYAPEIAAPATIPAGRPKAFPIPIKATPIVADVLQLLPVANETTAHKITHAGKKILGFIISNP